MRGVALIAAAFALAAGAEAEPTAADDYQLHCSGCHRMDGSGTPGVVPSLDDFGRLVAADGGREYVGRVPGVAQAPLDDARLARLLNWAAMRFGGVSPGFESVEVRALRQSPLRDPGTVRPVLR